MQAKRKKTTHNSQGKPLHGSKRCDTIQWYAKRRESEKLRYLLIYLACINLAGAVAVVLDKRRAGRGAWRIPERTLFAFCVLGGCPGVYFAMRAVRHKTLHKRFMLGIPAIFILQIAIMLLIYYKMYGGFHL